MYAPNGHKRNPLVGSESLGVHCEGPFLSLSKKGAHDPSLLQTSVNGIQTLEDFYGLENLVTPTTGDDGGCLAEPQPPVAKSCHSSSPPVRQNPPRPVPVIRKITVAPELHGMLDAIQELTHRHGTIVAMGHSAATYEQGLAGLAAGATMITHTFNAMEPFLHRGPGLVGLLSASEADLDLIERKVKRPLKLWTDYRRHSLACQCGKGGLYDASRGLYCHDRRHSSNRSRLAGWHVPMGRWSPRRRLRLGLTAYRQGRSEALYRGHRHHCRRVSSLIPFQIELCAAH